VSVRKEQLAENVTLYCGDCREVLQALPRPEAVISDPPYGQRQNTNIMEPGRNRGYRPSLPNQGQAAHKRANNGTLRGSGFVTMWPEAIAGDDEDFDPAHLLDAADIVLLWGAHRFGSRLPAGTTLIWDKVPTGKTRDQGDGEVAWLNVWPPRPLRIFRLLWDGVCVGQAARHEVTAGQPRVHPTQKPEALMEWCVREARVPAGGVICDPYMGAGSTGVAAVRAGYGFVGCEIEPLYFETAIRRISDELRRPRLFAEPIAKPVQQTLFAEESAA
jgi:site-specific DNA-methyltransferase (adenine-specific)/modification methylase